DLHGHTFVAEYRLLISAVQSSAPGIQRETLQIRDVDGQLYGSFDRQQSATSEVQHWRPGPLAPKAFNQARESLSFVRQDAALLGAIGIQPFLDLAEGIRSMGFHNFHPG